ncbi:MAG: 2-amino-4-hydroxy-6-hydroxymethyldihydropteridine diphosphokinase [Gammaproteobacteria bacterium]|nr:2-amino-4-hydroxy-6-hydroxymethyldihydropteridine diphosphokinase [Gammaproteobacteria bacterium]
MADVFLGIGSNIEATTNLRLGVGELRRIYGELELSAVYRSPPYGFTGDDFLNLVARLETTSTPHDIHNDLERIHELAGRSRAGGAYVARTLDIDLLMYDQLVLDEPPVRIPRDDVLEYSFVLKPLSEMAPQLVHPVTGVLLAEAWAVFDQDRHPIERIDVIL